METTIRLGAIEVDVVLKDIKNVHLSVHPPTGRVRIAAPARMNVDAIRLYAISKLDWIKSHQRALVDQQREPEREFLERESHYVWGKRYLLELHESDNGPGVELDPRHLRLTVRTGSPENAKRRVLESWYRQEVRLAAHPLIEQWSASLDVRLSGFSVRRMKTKWGACSPDSQTIRLNTELAKKPPECLEYIVVHELAHLREPTHNARFLALLDRCLPDWRTIRESLNRLPVRHETWTY
jgi:predicted metal-dependent hydrolase